MVWHSRFVFVFFPQFDFFFTPWGLESQESCVWTCVLWWCISNQIAKTPDLLVLHPLPAPVHYLHSRLQLVLPCELWEVVPLKSDLLTLGTPGFQLTFWSRCLVLGCNWILSSNFLFQRTNESFAVVSRDPDAPQGSCFLGIWLGLHTEEEPLGWTLWGERASSCQGWIWIFHLAETRMSQLTLEHTLVWPVPFRAPVEGCVAGDIFKKIRQPFRIICGDLQGEDQERKCFFLWGQVLNLVYLSLKK